MRGNSWQRSALKINECVLQMKDLLCTSDRQQLCAGAIEGTGMTGESPEVAAATLART